MREQIGPYRIERVLGEGAMGIVYLGRHEVLGRQAAIKTALRQTTDAHLRKRLLAEARAQSRLLHPNVVTVYEPIEAGGELFVAMEYVHGESLAMRLERSPASRLTVDQALPLFVQLLDALEFVHGEKIVHRDVKPSNVMVSTSDRVKLTDFGIALLAGEPRLTASLRIAGTPQYMSPEQLQGQELDRRTDIYSAGLVLYRMLAGRPAFEAKEYLAQIHERLSGPPDPRTFHVDVPDSVWQTLAIALHVEPAQRFQSAADFRDELSRAAVGFFPAPPPTFEIAAPAPVPAEPVPPPEADSHHAARGIAWTVIVGSLMAATSVIVTRVDAPREAVQSQAIPPQSRPDPSSPSPAEPPFAESPRPRPRRTAPAAPKADPPLATPPGEDDGAARAAEQRRRDLDALREEIRKGLTEAAAGLQAENFGSALDALDRVDGLARHETELVAERDEIARVRTAVMEAQQQHRVWQARLEDIRSRIRTGDFPEAIGIAEDVKNDPQTPPAVATRADALLLEAKSRLAETFQAGTRMGPTKNEPIRKPSSPPRKND